LGTLAWPWSFPLPFFLTLFAFFTESFLTGFSYKIGIRIYYCDRASFSPLLFFSGRQGSVVMSITTIVSSAMSCPKFIKANSFWLVALATSLSWFLFLSAFPKLLHMYQGAPLSKDSG